MRIACGTILDELVVLLQGLEEYSTANFVLRSMLWEHRSGAEAEHRAAVCGVAFCSADAQRLERALRLHLQLILQGLEQENPAFRQELASRMLSILCS